MNTILSQPGSQPDSQPDWSQLSPLLDEAMHKLDEQDREAVLLRHFENCSFAEIGGKIGLTENAARMRVERALEKLHGILAAQGVSLTVLVLAGLLTANAVGAVPAHLAAKIVGGALASVAAGGALSAFVSNTVAFLKTHVALIGTSAALLGVFGFIYASHSLARTGNNSSQPARGDTSTNRIAQQSAVSLPATNLLVRTVPEVKTKNGRMLHLQLVTADSGKPIPNVLIDYRGWAGGQFKGKQFTSNRFGECDVDYPTNITLLELTTRKDGFADTQLLWRPPNGETIPTNYLVRVDWPVAIGGQVVDADGNPVAGAKVGWNNQDDPGTLTLPQNHNFGWIETTTDENGKWRINRMAEDMIARIYGSAQHSNYVGSAMVFAGRDPAVEKQFRAGTYVFKLGRAVTVTGIVVDSTGNPVPDAKVLVGHISETSARHGKTQTDGTFSINGCPPGKQLVTAIAKGFAPTTIEADLGNISAPIRLTLTAGKILRLRVMDTFGNPIPNTTLWYDCINGHSPDYSAVQVQLDFNPVTDQEGIVMLTNAPDTVMNLTAYATGFLRVGNIKVRPDGEEHIITLPNALVVHGIVYDDATGRRLPKFRIAQGWPVVNPVEGTTNVQWSSIGRFWLDFSGGTYTNTFEEGVVGGAHNPGYVLKFMADGYAPFVSRVIGANEGDVELNVSLRRASAITVTVYKPDGQLAVLADIGLAAPGARLQLTSGGFSRENMQSGGSLLRTDANGTFALQPDNSVTQVIAASPDGYGEATPTVLTADPIIQMQAWGRLEATCFSGGKAAGGQEYGLAFVGIPPESLAFEFGASRVTSDAQGTITIEKLPPGKLNLIQHHLIPHGWSDGEKTPFEIKPGETTTLTLGASNSTVTAHLIWPAGMQRQANWQISANIHTPMPVIPSEIRNDPAALKEYVQSAEFKASLQNHRSYPATVNDDNMIVVEGIAPGDYQLSVGVVSPAGSDESAANTMDMTSFKAIAGGNVSVIIPADQPPGTVDVGNVQLEPATSSP